MRGHGRKAGGVTSVCCPCSKAMERTVALGETGRAAGAACHLVAREALEPMTATLREGGLCCAQVLGLEARGGQTRGVQFFPCSALGCHLASSLLFRILGQVWSARTFVGNCSVVPEYLCIEPYLLSSLPGSEV